MKSNELKAFALVLWVVLVAAEALLIHSTLYTQGEVVQGLFRMLLGLNLAALFFIFWNPKIGLWATVAVAALMLPWQAWEIRRWAVIHEEVLAVIQHLEVTKREQGAYPSTLDGHTFEHGWVRDHIRYSPAGPSYRMSYHMHDPGISYWYEPGGGFGYYPD